MKFANNHILEKLSLLKTPPKEEETTTSIEYSEFQHLTAFKSIYTDANNQLRDTPYALQKRTLYYTAFVWKVVYPFLSFLLGLGSVLLFATTYTRSGTLTSLRLASRSTLINLALIGLGIVFLLVVIEVIKSLKANTIFRAKAKKENVGRISATLLGVVMLCSILLSATGGAFLSFELGDQSRSLKTGLQQRLDSIQAVYARKQAQNDQIIQGLQSLQINPKLRPWGLTKEENEQLRLAQTAKKNLALAQDKTLNETRSKYDGVIQQSVSYTSITMLVVVVIVTMMELFNLWSYYFIWVYRKKVQDEGLQFGILPVNNPDQSDHVSIVAPAIAASSNSVTTNTSTSTSTTTSTTKRKHDFTTDSAAVGTEIECNHKTCDNRFQKRSYNHRFCSDKCRLDFHGFDLKRRRKRE